MQRLMLLSLGALLLNAPAFLSQSAALISSGQFHQPDYQRFDLHAIPKKVVITEYYARVIADSLRPAGIRRTTTLTFDDHGNLTTAVKESPRTTIRYRYQYTYGPHGPTQLTISYTNGIPRAYRTYEYDAGGRLRKVTVSDQYRRPTEVHTYQWEKGRPTRETIQWLADSTRHEITRRYARGLLIEKNVRYHPDSPAAVQTAYTYDAHGRRIRSQTTPSEGPPVIREYFYDQQGRRIREKETRGTNVAVIQYFYPPDGQDWTRMVREGRRPAIIQRTIE